MNFLTKIFSFIILIQFFSCKKERSPLSWNTDIVAPVFYGDLSITDLLADSVIQSNPDQSIQLNFSTNIYQLNFDSLVKLPDTTIENAYTIPFSAGINCAPGQTFVSEPENISLNINDVELTQVKIKGGTLHYTISSNISGDVIYDYSIANATNSFGESFIKTVTVPAANNSSSLLTGSFSLAGYTIDLTGTNQNTYNTLSTLIQIKLSENHNGNLTITNQDSVLITNTISNLQIEYAEGYFGNQLTTIANNKNELQQMQNIIGGSVDLAQVDIDLEIINGIGADAKFSIGNLNSMSSTANIPLSHAIIGSENHLNRAQKNGNDITPFVFSTNLNSNNSNIEQWIENLPDSILYSLDLELNPLGNISGHHDFIRYDAPFEINMGIDMPLSFIANELILVDTITINTAHLEQVIKGKLLFEIENGFPLEATLSLKNNANNIELFSNNIIESGIVNNSGIVEQSTTSNCEVILNEAAIELLKQDHQLILHLTFDSPDGYSPLNIYDFYRIKFKSIADFTYQNKIQ
ncbi:MAG: hypothetical protein N4A35_10875 [Flavobacteriales bacterium]|jgi:hypothetical protein|nr:hypothetical protein [Flavobacteriales bacterium]